MTYKTVNNTAKNSANNTANDIKNDNTHSSETITAAIWRGEERGQLVDFEIELRANQTVLDVVTEVQRSLEPTLAYRFACRVGVCGSCAMTVNGKPRWTCRTHVNNVLSADNRITIEPLRHLPLIKDLACDMEPFFRHWQRAGAVFEGTATRHDEIPGIGRDDPMRRVASEGIECINCAVCYSACDVVGWNQSYTGPAALNRVWTLVNDERQADRKGLLHKAFSDGACGSCHSHGNCTRSCPIELNPSRSIAGLKRASIFGVPKDQ